MRLHSMLVSGVVSTALMGPISDSIGTLGNAVKRKRVANSFALAPFVSHVYSSCLLQIHD